MSAGPSLLFPAGRPPFRLTASAASAGLAVLVLAPHPDDFDEVGVTLRRLRGAGGKIRLSVLSSSANGVEDAFLDRPTDEAKAAVREEEQRRSLLFFGLGEERLSFERLPTGAGGFLRDASEGLDAVRRILAEEPFDIVILPHGHDTNPDHVLVSEWLRRAVPPGSIAPSAWLFRDPKTVAMRLDLVVPFDDEEASWKAELLRCHASQQARNLRQRGYGLDERILRINRETARAAGLAEPYAEGFEIVGTAAEPISEGGASPARRA
ncbi:MAG: PIG-L family deacetylase [Candidatus Aminicenantes bacterium]|nr:PIG-L family deacetylase [Candidatus Aminicenantes bacterium]